MANNRKCKWCGKEYDANEINGTQTRITWQENGSTRSGNTTIAAYDVQWRQKTQNSGNLK